jgi:hypothetical protein
VRRRPCARALRPRRTPPLPALSSQRAHCREIVTVLRRKGEQLRREVATVRATVPRMVLQTALRERSWMLHTSDARCFIVCTISVSSWYTAVSCATIDLVSSQRGPLPSTCGPLASITVASELRATSAQQPQFAHRRQREHMHISTKRYKLARRGVRTRSKTHSAGGTASTTPRRR